MSAVFVRGESAGGIQNGVTFVQTDKQEIDVSQEELPTCRKDQLLENVFAVVANDQQGGERTVQRDPGFR